MNGPEVAGIVLLAGIFVVAVVDFLDYANDRRLKRRAWKRHVDRARLAQQDLEQPTALRTVR